jgi:arylsulfatase
VPGSETFLHDHQGEEQGDEGGRDPVVEAALDVQGSPDPDWHDRGIERALPEFAGRPTLVQGNRQPLFGGMGRLSENSVVNIKNKSHAVTAEIVVPDGGAQGVMVAQGGGIGGWSLHVRDGEPRYRYNLLGIQRFSTSTPTARSHRARTRFEWSSPTRAEGSGRAGRLSCSSTAR